MGMTPSTDESAIVQRLLAVGTIILLGVFLGMQVARGYVFPAALVVGFALLFLLFARPQWFLLLSIFVFYGSFGIVDMDVFGRVAGLFRLKDVFLVLMVGYAVTTTIIRGGGDKRTPLRSSTAYPAWRVFVLWVVCVYLYTVVVLGEDKMLALRVGRIYLSYAWPLLLLWWLRSEEDWKRFYRFLYFLGFIAIGLAVLGSFGASIQLYSNDALPPGIGSAESLGIYRAGNEGESLVYALFIISFWRFIHRQSFRNAAIAFIFAFGSSLFLFRTRLAGVTLGIALSSLFVSWRLRMRAVRAGVIGIVVLLGAIVVFGLFAKTLVRMDDTPYVARIVQFFQKGVDAVLHGEVSDSLGRKFHVQMRWPLVKEHPLIGIGFISPFGSLAWEIYMKGGMPIGIADVGWIDLLVRLGFVGVFLIGALYFFVARDARTLLRVQELSDEERSVALAMIGYCVLATVSVYSFSYPSWEPCIVTFSLLFTMVVHIRRQHEKPLAATEKASAAFRPRIAKP